MRLKVGNIFAVCAGLFFLIGCSCSKTRIIPKGKMAHIYAEMLIMDQWIAENSRFRTQADTSLVYEPILNEYGYTTEDYRASVSHYMNDPERYSRILRNTTELLDEKLVELKELKRIEDRKKAIVPYEIDEKWLFYKRYEEGLWETGDSISVALDSLQPIVVFTFHHTSDTTYDGLNIVIREKVDTVIAKDTVAVKETPKETIQDAPKEIVRKIPEERLNVTSHKLFSTVADSLKRK